MIADFGGGTSDFSVVRVGGPGGAQVLSTSGVAIAGDAFDARLVDHVVSPALGRGSTYEAELGRRPPWLYSNLRRWHPLSFLRSPKTTALLDKIRHGASDPAGIDRLIHVIEDDLGLPLHQSIEANKRSLSASAAAPFAFDDAGISLAADVARADFDAWIAEDLAAIDEAVREALDRAGVTARAVQRVFATGGSSLVPVGRAASGPGRDTIGLAMMNIGELTWLQEWYLAQCDGGWEHEGGPVIDWNGNAHLAPRR